MALSGYSSKRGPLESFIPAGGKYDLLSQSAIGCKLLLCYSERMPIKFKSENFFKNDSSQLDSNCPISPGCSSRDEYEHPASGFDLGNA
jgi:hypothetical protein